MEGGTTVWSRYSTERKETNEETERKFKVKSKNKLKMSGTSGKKKVDIGSKY
jgi:hypothetical protein